MAVKPTRVTPFVLILALFCYEFNVERRFRSIKAKQQQQHMSDETNTMKPKKKPSLRGTHQIHDPSDTPSDHIHDKTIADDCYHVFIDAGSNRGVHGRFLFEPDMYPKSKFAPKLDRIFGPDDRTKTTCVFAFEPNPFHYKNQMATQNAYKRMGWRYYYMPYGVGDANEQLTFFRNYDYMGGSHNEEWGFGRHFYGSTKENQTLLVDVVDLSQWLQDVILPRKIPSMKSKRKPAIVIKMDIEGSEYKTLTKMHNDDAVCKVDYILGELHHDTAPLVVGGLNITNEQQLRKFGSKLLKKIRKGRKCRGFQHFDDEEYLHDGMPYPEPLEREDE